MLDRERNVVYMLEDLMCPSPPPSACSPLPAMPAGDFTEAEFPCTRDGHRRLLAKANYFRQSTRRAFALYYDELRAQREQWMEAREASRQIHELAAADDSEVLETTLNKFQQLVQELGRNCQCPVCFGEINAAEMNPEHAQYMKVFYCGHLLRGACAFRIKYSENQNCPTCRGDVRSQLASVVEPKAGAESKLRPKRDKSDLRTEGDKKIKIPPGAFITSYKGSCYVCDSAWVAGATIAKHRRARVKETCVQCAAAPMPCEICRDDASASAVLKNGKGESKRFFCQSCVKKNHKEGNPKGITGATSFLRKRAKPDKTSYPRRLGR